jgi:hypothetical protein
LPREDIIDKVFEAQSEYELQKKLATSSRGKFLDDLATAWAEAGLESATKALKVMQQREKVRKNNRVINRVMKPSQRRPLNMVKTFSASGVTLTHVSQQGIEEAGLDENEH